MMNQKKMIQLISEGRTKIEEAHALILSDKADEKEHLITLQTWFWQNAVNVKHELQNELPGDEVNRQMLERLVNEYTIVISEIDEKINQDNLLDVSQVVETK